MTPAGTKAFEDRDKSKSEDQVGARCAKCVACSLECMHKYILSDTSDALPTREVGLTTLHDSILWAGRGSFGGV
jgi:hypothetical protein